MPNFVSAVRIILGICIIIFVAACFLSFWFFVINKLPTSHNTVRYLRKRIPPHNKGIYNLEEQLRLLEAEYSNEISAVSFRDTDNSVLGGYCSWFTKTSVMCQEYAYLLITKGDDIRLQNAFQYSLAHERGHIGHSFLKIFWHYHNLCLTHWVDEVLADIAAFKSIYPDWENLSNEIFQQALDSFQDAIHYKISYRIVRRISKNLDKRKYEGVYRNIYECNEFRHPAWKNRYMYVSMLRTNSIDDIIQKVEKDCKKWRSGQTVQTKIKSFWGSKK